MTEERKVQLKVGADTTEAVAKVGQLEQTIAKIGPTGQQAGQQAAAGLSKVGESAAASATKADASARSLIASAQRSTAALKAGQKGTADYIDSLGAVRGVDPAKLKPVTDQLRAEEAIQASKAAAARAAAFIADAEAKASAATKTPSQLFAAKAAQFPPNVQAQVAPHIAAMEAAEKAAKGFADTGRKTRYELQQIAFQLNDLGVQLVSGQNPLLALVQQGSQLSGTFGGTGNALRAVMSLITPMRAAMIAAAAGVGVLALAMLDAEKSARALNSVQAQLIGTGRGGMFSTKELEDFEKQLSQTPGVTREAAEQIVSEFSKVGGVSKAVFAEAAKRVAVFAKATGTELPAAAKTLAQALADPEKGAADLAKTLTNFPAGARLAAESMARMGDIAGATAALLRGVDVATKGVKVEGTPLEESLKKLTEAWQRAEDTFRRSDGLRALNTMLGTTLGLVTAIVDKIPKLGGITNIGAGTVGLSSNPLTAPLAGPSAIASLLTAPFKRDKNPASSGGASGSWEAGGASGSPATAPLDNTAARDLINKQLDVAKGFKTEAAQIKELQERREGMNRALAQSNRLYDEAKAKAPSVEARKRLDEDHARESGALRDGVAGIDKQIFGLGKGQGVLDAQLQAEIKKAQDALAAERDTRAFESKKSQALFQGGQTSLADVFDKRRQEIERGTAAEIAALEVERAAVQEHLAKSRDPDKKEQDRARLKQIDADEGKIDLRGKRELELANIELGVSTDQLNEKLLNYRSNLKAAAGDEVGAAKLRRDIADQQDKIFAGQAAKSGSPITQADLDDAKRLREQQDAITQAKIRTSLIDQQLQIAEDRISLAQNTGAIGEIEALNRQGAARAAMLPAMREQLAILEKLSQERPGDLQLKIDVEGFRLQVDKLQSALDPLAERFNGMFQNAGANLFGDLMNGTFSKVDLGKMEQKLDAVSRNFQRKQDEIRNSNVPEAQKVKAESAAFKERLAAEKSARKDADTSFLKQLGEAGKSFGASITKELNGMLAKELSASLFGKGGAASGVGSFFASIFGGPKAAANTAQQSFRATEIAAENAADKPGEVDAIAASTTQATAAVKSARALDDLTTAAQSAAVAMSKITGEPLAPLEQAAASPGEPFVGSVVGDGDAVRLAIADIKDPTERANALQAFTEQARRTPDFAKTGKFSGEQSVMDQFGKAADSGKKLSAANTQAATAALSLARTARDGGNALSLLPRIIALIQTSAGGSAGSSGGSVPFLSSIFGKGGYGFGGTGAGASFLATDSVAGMTNAAALEAGIIPLSDGGYTGNKDPKKVAGIVHGGEYVFSEPTVRAIGLDRLERLHKQAKAGHTEVPGYSEGGYVSVPGQRMQWTARSPQNLTAKGDSYVTNHTTHVNVTATPNTSRATALQTGREVGRGIELARRRNG